jgi:hypothetical protein
MRRLGRRALAIGLVVAGGFMSVPEAAAASVFTGAWYAHDASLKVGRGGMATETIWAYVFCATAKGPGPADYMTINFRILGINHQRPTWTARVRVTRIRHNCRLGGAHRLLQVGDRGRFRLNNGVIHESLTGRRYCDPVKARKGICGA